MEKGASFETMKIGVLAAILAVALPDLACATSVRTVLDSVASTQMVAVPRVLSAVCYLLGAFLMVSGALSLKKHAENPASEPMSKGLGRLITGGAVISIPALTGVISNSLGVAGTGQVTYTSLTSTF